MKALRSFTVRPRLPHRMAALQDLAMNLRWSWDEQTRDLFRWVDPHGWDASRHDPVRLLGMVSQDRIVALQSDPGFMRFLTEVEGELQRYLRQPRWFQARAGTPLRSVAYFSPEFGIAEALPQYSGGLGVLAGDHLKTASDLGVPIVGVGLFYRHGYFRQLLSGDGWQQEVYTDVDPYGLALSLCDGARVEVELAEATLTAQVWKAEVGRVALYLLDADIDDNAPDVRIVTDRLYGGDTEHRLRQEILLGVGGVRALEAVGESPQVFHTNEGHAGFLGLERIRRCIADQGLTYAEAIEAVRAGNIFTTHTPVPAGIDRFSLELMGRYFGKWAQECGIGLDQLMALGHRPGDRPDEPFNMAVMGLRLSARSNAVSRLHGEVSREMFADLWPDVPPDESPITSVTNGVHPSTWVSAEMDDLLVRYVLPEWQEAGPERWALVDGAADDELWRVREQGRERLVGFVRRKLREEGLARGQSDGDLAWTDEILDPRALTICFARRFATYKRATLLLSDEERLVDLLLSADRPVQFVFAGKAHPADEHGKEMIRRIVQFARDPRVRHRFVFLEDYDIAVARALLAGADVWLNNPRRPQEACGTSGMKAVLNGALHCSVLDGWWDELYDGTNGWAVPTAAGDDLARRDAAEASSLFEVLERQVVPLFYERYGGGVPRGWVRRMRASLRTLGPQVSAARMVRDYVERLYEPTAAAADAMSADGFARARALAAWKARVRAGWDAVEVRTVEAVGAVGDLGAETTVQAAVALGPLSSSDVEVQLVHGAVGQSGELDQPAIAVTEPAGDGPDGTALYAGTFTCDVPGRYGYTVRVVPSHPDLVSAAEVGRMTVA